MSIAPDDDLAPSARLRTQVWLLRGLTLLALTVMFGSGGWFLWQEREQELGHAADLATRRSLRLAEDLRRTLELARIAIVQSEARLQDLPAGTPIAGLFDPRADERAQLLAVLQVAFELHPVDAQGRRIGGDGGGDHQHALPPLAPPGPRAWQVGPPVKVGARRILPLVRAAGPNAHGIAAWAVDLDHDALVREMQTLREPDGGSVALFRAEADGAVTLLTRLPFNEAEIGTTVRGPIAEGLARGPEGRFTATARFDGAQRISAFRRLDGDAASLVAAYGFATDRVLADWFGGLPWLIGLELLVAIGIVAGSIRLERSLRSSEQAHGAARRSEQQFRALAGNMPDVVVRLDREGRHLYVNPAVERATGLKPEHFLGRTNAELGMPLANVEAWMSCLRRVVEGGQAEWLRFDFQAGPALRHWESQVVPETDASGRVASVLVISRDITEARAAEQALRDSEERLRLALEAANQGLYDLDLRTGDAVVTPEYARMLGHDPASFRETNEAWRERLHPDDREAVYGAFEAYIAGRIPEYRVEFRQRTRDGSWKWVLSLGKVQQRDAEGRPLRMLGTHTDITPFKLAQAALADSVARFRHLFERNPAPMLVYDRGTLRLLAVNEAFTLQYGYPPEQALGMHLPDLHVPAQRAALNDLVPRLSGLADVGEWDHLTRDGRRVTVAVRSHDLVFDGHAARVVVMTDVTERRRAEDAVRQMAAALEQRVEERTAELARSEARLRKIFETVPIAIGEEDWSGVQRLLRRIRDEGIVDGPGYFATRHDFVLECLRAVRVLRLNQRALELHEASESSGSPIGLEAFYPEPEDLPQFVGELEAMWRGERRFTSKKTLPSLAGRPLSLMLTMSMPGIDDADGTALVCLVDITEIDRLNAELDRSVARLRQVNQELETFTYSVSHDLKAPLRGIDGYSRLLLEDHQARLDEEGREFLGHIRRATQHMAVLIDDLLAYSRLERRELTLVRLPLLALVDTVLAAFRGEIAQRGVRLDVAIDPALAVTGDSQGLSIALRNLIDNALKFGRDSVAPRIEITATRNGDVVRLTVRDNGPGFDMKFHDRIFTIFQRLHRAEDFPGTGVGLAIVRKAMERMGGRAWAESRPGQGAAFTLELPEAT